MIAADDHTEQIFFHGVVTDFSIRKEGNVCTLFLEVSSGTFLMDLKTHQRFYQAEHQPISDIIEEICSTYESCSCLIVKEQECLLNQFTAQYLETDWQFFKRLAGRCHFPLIPADTIPGIHFYVGITKRSCYEVNQDSYITANDLQDYYRRSSQIELLPFASVSYQFISREIYELGCQIIFNGCEMYIYEILSEYTHGELIHEYKVRGKAGFDTVYQPNASMIGVSFDAAVAEIEKDQVLIHILNGENTGQSPVKPFPFSTVYSSPDGAGWYCMPEPGDRVRLYIPSENEADAYVISAVHQKSADSNARVNPSVKSLKTRYGKEVYFAPDSIVLTNHKGNKITMHDLEGIFIESSHDIVIKAEGDISFASTGQTLLMNAADKIDICQGGTTLTIDDDIVFKGGKLRME